MIEILFGAFILLVWGVLGLGLYVMRQSPAMRWREPKPQAGGLYHTSWTGGPDPL